MIHPVALPRAASPPPLDAWTTLSPISVYLAPTFGAWHRMNPTNTQGTAPAERMTPRRVNDATASIRICRITILGSLADVDEGGRQQSACLRCSTPEPTLRRGVPAARDEYSEIAEFSAAGEASARAIPRLSSPGPGRVNRRDPFAVRDSVRLESRFSWCSRRPRISVISLSGLTDPISTPSRVREPV